MRLNVDICSLRFTDLVLWHWGLALSIRCLALALTVVAPHRRATRGGRHARHRADLGNLGLLGSAGQEGNHSHLSSTAEGREPEHTREGRKHLEIWVYCWDHCITWWTEKDQRSRSWQPKVKRFYCTFIKEEQKKPKSSQVQCLYLSSVVEGYDWHNLYFNHRFSE